MDYIHEIMNSRKFKMVGKREFVPFVSILNNSWYSKASRNKDHGDFVIHRIRQMRATIKEINDNYKSGKVKITEGEKSAFVNQEQENCFFDIIEKRCNPHTVYYLLRKIEETETKSIRTSYFNLIFNLALPGLNQMIKNCKEKCSYLVEDENGSIDIFGKHYQIVISEDLVA